MKYSNSNRLRLTGKLIKEDRRFVLQCDDESVWKLDFQDIAIPKENTLVVIEGAKVGTDGVDVDWVGRKPIQ